LWAGGAGPAPRDAERARVALLRFDNAFFLQGRVPDLHMLDEAAVAVADPFWRDQLLDRRSFVMSFGRGPRAVVETAPTSLMHPGSEPLTAAHMILMYNLSRLGRLDEVTRLLSADPTSAATPAPDQPWVVWALFSVRVTALIWAGRLREADELLTRAQGVVIDQPAAEASAFVAERLASLHLEQGRLTSAFRRASESYTLFQQLGRGFFAAQLPYADAAQALALAGQANRAAETLAALDALGVPAMLINQTEVLQARAWTAAAAGDLPAARQQLEAAADLGEEIGDLIGAVSALHGLARLGHARQVSARLAALATHVDGDLVAARAAYTSALAARDGEVLGKVAGDFEDLGTILYAAEASAEAAVLLRHAGEARRAAAAEQRAARLLARCEGAATPPVRFITARVRLTQGELDTAMQAAAGRSNKQIAAERQLSVRTVESHLQRAYEKLGISGRHELAGALQDQPTA
jgi:DNA-binding CsgD family transcriptional regulator